MRNILTGLTFFFVSHLFAQSDKESIRATYQAAFIFDYEQSKDLFPKDLQPVFKASIDQGVFVDFILESNGILSSFKPDIKLNNAQDHSNSIVQEILASENNPLYKDFMKNEYYKQFDINVKTFLVKDNLTDYQWKLTKEKIMINGYHVVKAIGEDADGNEVLAWYSPEVRFKDGPHTLANLPGLILKAEMITPYFKVIFTINQLEILKNPLPIHLPTKGKITSFDDMRKELNTINTYSE